MEQIMDLSLAYGQAMGHEQFVSDVEWWQARFLLTATALAAVLSCLSVECESPVMDAKRVLKRYTNLAHLALS